MVVNPELAVAYGLAVRRARVAAGLSQERLSELAGLDRTYVSALERGLRNPTLTTQAKIADALGLPMRELVPDSHRGKS